MDSLGSQLALGVLGLVVAYVVVAYLVMPAFWRRYASRHPMLADVPGISQTSSGIPGDPLNVALVGTVTELGELMDLAGLSAADPLSLRSDLRIAIDTVRKRPYGDAPVSSLYLWNRKEDLAFEQQVHGNPRERHHVRLWQSGAETPDGRPLWVGSATFDRRVGFSDLTGQVTHHIDGNIDAERAYLFAALKSTGRLSGVSAIKAFHKVCSGRNGGGDHWHTDGALVLGVIAATAAAPPAMPSQAAERT